MGLVFVDILVSTWSLFVTLNAIGTVESLLSIVHLMLYVAELTKQRLAKLFTRLLNVVVQAYKPCRSYKQHIC